MTLARVACAASSILRSKPKANGGFALRRLGRACSLCVIDVARYAVWDGRARERDPGALAAL